MLIVFIGPPGSGKGTQSKLLLAHLGIPHMSTGELLRDTFPEVVVAGNMGVTALGQLPRLRPDVPIVIELSSWQIESRKR